MVGLSKGGNEVQVLECLSEHISYYQFMKKQLSLKKTVSTAGVRTEECRKDLPSMKRFKT
jgi:hypothetical protein